MKYFNLFIKEFVKYSQFARISFLNYLAYRVNVVMMGFIYFFVVVVNFFLWNAIFTSGTTDGSKTLAGFNSNELITYIIVGWVLRSSYISHYDREIGEKIRNGTIAMDLLKPVNFQFIHYADSIGRVFIRVFTLSIPTLIIANILFKITLPVSWEAFLLFLLSGFCSLFIFVGLNFIVGITAFFTENYNGIANLKDFLIISLSGLLIPYAFFPEIFQYVLQFLPFQGMANIPLSIYIGKLTGIGSYLSILSQILWSVLIFIIGSKYWSVVKKSMFIEGG
jgi:ABC-2 type transport system permease protein